MSLKKLKDYLKEQEIDYFVQPNVDEFFSEYLPQNCKRLEFITNFTGSNAVVVFTAKKSYFFTDGRYILQAAQQLDLKEFEIINLADISLLNWLKDNLNKSVTLAFDAKLFDANFVDHLHQIISDKNINIWPLSQNPIDSLMPQEKAADSAIYFCDDNLVGMNSMQKRQLITQNIDGDILLITNPENICWLLNIRASDIKYSPLLLAYGILYKDNKFDLFIDKERLDDIENHNLKNVTILDPQIIETRISQLKNNVRNIQLDRKNSNFWLCNFLTDNGFNLIDKKDPINLAKSIKNSSEIAGSKKAHEIDGLAVTKFLCWLDTALNSGQEIDELSAAKKLLNLRQENAEFIYPSFATISSFGSNGAIIHYQPCAKTNEKITKGSLYLVDSGGQYQGNAAFGTTDITRTILFGQPSVEMIANFTRVLKGHIALARAKFPKGTSGSQLDILARFHLWQAGLNYDHGTGHGVGSFLSVHEGPCGISKNYHQQLLPGMIISNEPGYYKAGEYGIRIENLLLVEEVEDDFLQFKTLSLAPIDYHLIDFKMLTYPERQWLKKYHQEISNKIGPKLNEEENQWLQLVIDKFSRL